MTMPPVRFDLLRTLVAIAEAGGFSAAARRLSVRQSTISQHVKQLEEATGRRLVDRDTHRVALTAEGDAVLEHARRVLDAQAGLDRYLSGAPLQGRLRVGASEDFVLSALPDVLAGFARRYPEVELELTAGLSERLYDAYDAGRLDLIFVKRRTGDPRGLAAWREPIAWVGRVEFRLAPDAPLPLLLYPPPSVTRALALDALERARRTWRIALTSASLSGLSAAARAGVGLMPHSRRLMPGDLAVIAPGRALPPLPEIEFVIIGPSGRAPAAETLRGEILQWAASGRTAR
jgi:DNA-binding transcriptional LysR family regulator